jgi:hypothetical protein
MKKQNPKIVVSQETKNKLALCGTKLDTFEEIILKLMNSYKKQNEKSI